MCTLSRYPHRSSTYLAIARKKKPLLYKLLRRPIWTHGIRLRDAAKISKISRVQRFQSKTLRTIFKVPLYVSNHTLRDDPKTPYVSGTARNHYKRCNSRLAQHEYPPIFELRLIGIPNYYEIYCVHGIPARNKTNLILTNTVVKHQKKKNKNKKCSRSNYTRCSRFCPSAQLNGLLVFKIAGLTIAHTNLRSRLSTTAILGAGVEDLSVRTHALIAARKIDAVHVRLARRVQTFVDVHALATEFPVTFGTPATVTAGASAVLRILREKRKKKFIKNKSRQVCESAVCRGTFSDSRRANKTYGGHGKRPDGPNRRMWAA